MDSQTNERTRRCKFYNNPLYINGCIHGNICKYLHDDNVDFTEQDNPQREVKQNKVCEFFKEGLCLKSHLCQFEHPIIHNLEEFPPLSKSPSKIEEPIFKDNEVKKIEKCIYFTSAQGCRKGNSCLFIHDPDYIVNCKYETSTQECKKNNCPFKHSFSH